MFEAGTNYEEVYQELVGRLGGAPVAEVARNLGLERLGQGLKVEMFGRSYSVGPEGVAWEEEGQPPVANRIVLARYILHGGRGEPTGRFVPYRELPGGQDFARSLSQLVEEPLARHFTGRHEALASAARAMGGRDYEEISADVAMVVPALPKLPLLLIFNDADEEFPAEARILYDMGAPNFLDMECLAVLGLILTRELTGASP